MHGAKRKHKRKRKRVDRGLQSLQVIDGSGSRKPFWRRELDGLHGDTNAKAELIESRLPADAIMVARQERKAKVETTGDLEDLVLGDLPNLVHDRHPWNTLFPPTPDHPGHASFFGVATDTFKPIPWLRVIAGLTAMSFEGRYSRSGDEIRIVVCFKTHTTESYDRDGKLIEDREPPKTGLHLHRLYSAKDLAECSDPREQGGLSRACATSQPKSRK